jgi:hypothetical protein
MQVTLEHHTHAFAIQSLHHAYHVFGYEGALRHLQVYHGLQTLRPDGVPSNASTAGTAVVNTVINEPISYTRTQIPEAGRCTKVLSNGNQCTFHKSGDSEFCARHSKAEGDKAVKEEVKEDTQLSTESKVVVVEDKKEKQRAYQAAYRQKQKM